MQMRWSSFIQVCIARPQKFLIFFFPHRGTSLNTRTQGLGLFVDRPIEMRRSLKAT